jgi:hypothetical protein
MKKYRQDKINKLKEEDKKRVLEKLQKRREQIMFQERQLYDHAIWVELYKKRYISREKKKELRKIVHKDVKAMRKFTEDKTYYSDEEIMNLEDKIYYGSDSSGASDENYKAVMGDDSNPTFKSETSSEYLVNRDELEDYSEEGEYEMEEGEFEQDDNELAFDEEEKVADYNDGDLDTSQDSSQRSTKVIEFDEEGNFLNMKDDNDSSQGSATHGMTLEMTDLRP